MASDFSPVRLLRFIKLPPVFSGAIAAGQVFTGGEPLSLDGNGRLVRASSNPTSIVGVAVKGVAGSAVDSHISVYELGDGSMWRWTTARLARTGSGAPLVSPVQSDIGDQAGLIFVGDTWVVDTGATNKIAEILSTRGSLIQFKFLEGTAATLALTSLVIGAGGPTLYSNTPGSLTVLGGLFGKIDQRGSIVAGPIAGPNTANFNATRFSLEAGGLTLSNPTYEPPAGESTVHTIHVVSDATARTLTLASKYKLAGGGSTITTSGVLGEEQIISGSWNGTNWRCVVSEPTAA